MSLAATVTRFAPSPTGYLHLGHVRSAFEGWHAARAGNGRFLLRIEDIDRTRCREQYTAAIIEDLAWLGLDWDGPVRRQSEHFADYRRARSFSDVVEFHNMFFNLLGRAEPERVSTGVVSASIPTADSRR